MYLEKNFHIYFIKFKFEIVCSFNLKVWKITKQGNYHSINFTRLGIFRLEGNFCIVFEAVCCDLIIAMSEQPSESTIFIKKIWDQFPKTGKFTM